MIKKWSKLPNTMKDFKRRLKIDKEQIEQDYQNGNAMMVSYSLKWPIFIKFLGKTRESMFKQSIRIQNPNIDPKDELEKMKEVNFLFVPEMN